MSVITLSIVVPNIGEILQTFDTMKVRKSVDGEGGPYLEITAESPTAASLTSPTQQSYDISGKTLQLKVDSADAEDIIFTGANPITASEAADQVNAVIPGIASDESGYLKLESLTTGSASKMEIVGGGAAVDFGWSDGDRSVGKEAYLLLVENQTNYSFIDRDGDAGHYYQAAYYNTTTQQVSAWSDPFLGDAGTVLSSDSLSTGTVQLVDASGAAVPDQEISFYSQNEPMEVEGYQVGLSRAPIVIITDGAGYAEVTLVRGLRVKVVFEGTSLVREITIPDSAEFDLLELVADSPDIYSVISPQLPFAIRRTT